MNSHVISLGKISKDNLKCNIPRFQLYKSSYQLKLTHLDQRIILQTPKVFISQIKPGSLQITLPIQSWSPGVRLFYQVIGNIDNYIMGESGCTGKIYKILKKHFKISKNRFAKKYRKSIYSIDFCIHYMYLHLDNNYLIFDSSKNPLNKSLTKQTARFIIQLDYLWLRIENNELKSYGCHWKIEQIALIEDFPPLLRECLFRDENSCDKATQTDLSLETNSSLKKQVRKSPFSIASLLQARTKLGVRPSAAALLLAKSKTKKVDLNTKQKKNQKGFGISLQDIQGIRLKKTRVRKIIYTEKKTNNIPSLTDLRRKRILKRKVPQLIFSQEDLKSIRLKLKPIPKSKPKNRKLSFFEEALLKRFRNMAMN